MDDVTQNPAPDNETTLTLYRFCRNHGLSLNDQERSVQGIALSKVARERQLPHLMVSERVGRMWIKTRLYPEAFLSEWLARYTQAQAEATPVVDGTPEPKHAANG